MNRRTFFSRMFWIALFAGFTEAFLAACSSKGADSSGSGTTAACTTSGAAVSIGSNHGHTAPTVPYADINTSTQMTYALGAGSAGHSHNVTVTATDFSNLKSSATPINISTDADGTGHSHTVTFTCSG